MVDAKVDVEGTMRLPPVLDLAAAEGFLASILQYVQSDKQADRAPRLDASRVETLTLPCAQIILSAGRTYGATVTAPSDVFVKAFRDLGLDWPQDPNQACAPEPLPEVQLPEVEAQPPAPVQDQVEEPALAQVEAPVEAHALPHETAPQEPAPQEPAEQLLQALPQDELQELAQAQELVQVAALAQDQVEDPVPESVQSSDKGLAAATAQDEFQHQASTQMDETAMAKTIMTIDDSRTIRDMLMITLTDAGYNVLQGVDGQDGLHVLGDRPVDVVITDINMPKMDGYEVIRQLRKSPVHKVVPILVLTTESDKDKKMVARDAGATGWMVKPFDPENLIATIRKVCP
jgi:two-component system chemotaxis response regulator CheY